MKKIMNLSYMNPIIKTVLSLFLTVLNTVAKTLVVSGTVSYLDSTYTIMLAMDYTNDKWKLAASKKDND